MLRGVILTKKLVCFVLIAIIIFVALIVFPYLPIRLPTSHNESFSEDINIAIIELVESNLQAFYGSYNRTLMEEYSQTKSLIE